MSADVLQCFGFYTGEFACRSDGCKMVQQCKALANSDIIDVASDVLEELLDSIPDQPYIHVDSVGAALSQVLKPEIAAQVLGRQAQRAPVNPVDPIPNALGNVPVQDPF